MLPRSKPHSSALGILPEPQWVPRCPGSSTELPARHRKGHPDPLGMHQAQDFSFPLPFLGLCTQPHTSCPMGCTRTRKLLQVIYLLLNTPGLFLNRPDTETSFLEVPCTTPRAHFKNGFSSDSVH